VVLEEILIGAPIMWFLYNYWFKWSCYQMC
jgi:hypothetical protein